MDFHRWVFAEARESLGKVSWQLQWVPLKGGVDLAMGRGLEIWTSNLLISFPAHTGESRFEYQGNSWARMTKFQTTFHTFEI